MDTQLRHQSPIDHMEEDVNLSDSKGLQTPTLTDEKQTFEDVKDVESAAQPSQDSGPPDGGFAAWLVIIGCACGGFSTFGFANAFGVFQGYYQHTVPGATQSTIAWIGSLQYCLIFLPSFVSGYMTDNGWFKLPLFIGSCVLVAATFLVAECTQLWQLILCQGFAMGISSGIVFLPSLSVVPTWFDKNRGKAYGVLAVGSSVGGTILPIVLRRLLDSVGFKWTVRILAFIITGLMIFFNLTVRPRLPFKKHEVVHIPLRTLWENKSFVYYTIGVTIVWLGLYTPLGFFDVSAQLIGVEPTKSFYTIVTANAASGVGRLTSGFWADSFGSLNVLILFSFVASVTAFAWPYAHSFASLLVVAAIFGFSSGAFISLLASVISYMVPRQQMGRAVGVSGSIMSIGALVGNPIAGQILIASGGFPAVGGFAGGTIMLSVMFFIIARRHSLGQWKGIV